MKKVDTVDVDGIPVCVVTYSSGLTENSAVFNGPCSYYSDEEIEKFVRGQGDKSHPWPNRDVSEYYFSRAKHTSNLKLCETVLATQGFLKVLAHSNRRWNLHLIRHVWLE